MEMSGNFVMTRLMQTLGPFGEEKITRTLCLLPVSRPRCSITVAFTFLLLLAWSSWLHRLRHILEAPICICHVSSIRLPSLQLSTSVYPPCPFASKMMIYMDSDYLLNAPCRSFIRPCVIGPPVPTPFSLASPIPQGTTLKGGLALPCSLSEGNEDTPGHGVISCPWHKRSHQDTADLHQRGIARS